MNSVEGLAGVTRQYMVEPTDEGLHLLDLDSHVEGVAPEAARALVDDDPAVRQRVALALVPAASGRPHHS